MKIKFFLFLLWGPLLFSFFSKAEGATLTLKTLNPSSIPYVYYTLKDSRGTTLDYRKIPGGESQSPTVLTLNKWEPGQVRLECSYGKFVGSIDSSGKVHFSHQYLSQQDQEFTLMNRLNLKLTLQTSSPSITPQLQYLFLTNSGLVVRRNLPGESSSSPTHIVVRNIIPCTGHLSTSFGQFVVHVQNERKVVFVYRGVRKSGEIQTSIEGGQNFLTIRGVIFTGKEPDSTPEIPAEKTLGAFFTLPSKLEANDRRGARISLDGSRSKAPPGAYYFWKFSGGFREGVRSEMILPLGKHRISLTVTKDSTSDTIHREVAIQDTLPPDIEGKYVPVPMPGRSLYRLEIRAWDTVDPTPKVQARIPLPSRSAIRKVLSRTTTSITFSPGEMIVQGPDPQKFFTPLESQKSIVLQEGQLVEIVPSGEPFKITWKADETLLFEGRIPKVLLESTDKAGNRAQKDLVFEISSSQGASRLKEDSSEHMALDRGPSPLTILLSVLACFFIFGILFLRKS